MNRINFLRWTGGKYRVLGILYPLFPDCEEYYEPFLGSGAVLINKPRAYREVANDLDRELYILHKVMADKASEEELLKRLRALGENEAVFEEALETLEEYKECVGLTREDEIRIAMSKYVSVSLSFNGTGRNFSSSGKLRVAGYEGTFKFDTICDRYQGVEFHNMDGVELMEEVKRNQNAFVFADPPYVQGLRGNKKIYKCEMGDEVQIRMLETIKNAACKIMLCGYADENGDSLYDEYLFPYGWKRYKLADLTQACERVEKGKERKAGKEFIWVNYTLPECAKYFIALNSQKCA